MGLADTVTKAYMKDNSVFADAFNYLIYGGEAVVDPKQLQELDTTEIALPFGSQDEEGKQPEEAVQKYRDVLKTLAVKTDERCTYLVLGIENQTNVHYAMPVRNMLYDAMQYEKQVRQLAAAHRKKHDAGDIRNHGGNQDRRSEQTPHQVQFTDDREHNAYRMGRKQRGIQKFAGKIIRLETGIDEITG